MLVIVDYGVGNLASIQNMLSKIGAESVIASNEETIARAHKIILPGVGAFDACASQLRDSGLTAVLNTLVMENRKPVLGICVGMQLLLNGSEEGRLPGLGWVPGTNIRFKQPEGATPIKIPHMGWTEVAAEKPSPLLENMPEEPRFYFVHSYHAQIEERADQLLSAKYGYSFVAAIERKNILGVQFHPEKSHRFGMKLLENFVKNY